MQSSLQRTKCRLPLEECDPNSQDSGYGGTDGFQTRSFRFAEPLGVAPRRLSLEGRSPLRSPTSSSPLRKRVARPALFRSCSSGYESTDEGLDELFAESAGLESSLPAGLSSLISGDIHGDSHSRQQPMKLDLLATTPEAPRVRQPRPRLNLRRSFSLRAASSDDEDDGIEANSGVSRVRSCLFRSPNATCSAAKLGFDDGQSARINCRRHLAESPLGAARSFKRPSPPTSHSPILCKRPRNSDIPVPTSPSLADSPPALKTPPVLQRSYSERSYTETEAHEHIKSAIYRSTTDDDLTGDFSKQCALPLSEGQHEDLKSISAETLSRLMAGEFATEVAEFKIVDCRYPYEFEAGHIDGALNLYTKDMIEQFLLEPLTHKPAIEPEGHARRIIVFHCEFSWERGPNMSRFLRNIDRQRNKEHYPALHYPEIYLLHGGYQQFFKEQRALCSPQGYRPMKDPAHEADLRQFRIKSKSWQGERVSRTNVVTARANLMRLGF